MKTTEHSFTLALTTAAFLATGLHQPAKALGLGVGVSQPGADAHGTNGGHLANTGTNAKNTTGHAVNFSCTPANSAVSGGSIRSGSTGAACAFDSTGPTALSGNLFSDAVQQANIQAGTPGFHNAVATAPVSSPKAMPSIVALLSGLVGDYAKTTHAIVQDNKTTTTYVSAPKPLPILGAGAAFSHSRRLQKRLRSDPSK